MAFFQEFRPAREPMLRAPGSVIALIAVLVAAHVARVLAPAAVSEQILLVFALDPIVYSAQALKALGATTPSLFDLLTPPLGHIFVHANFTHLGLNCIWLLAFGPVVARRFGGGPFLLYFFLCGLMGAATFVALDWGHNVAGIGASGAISGLMGGAIRMIDFRQPWLSGATLPLAPLLSSRILLFSAVWLAINFATGLIGLGPDGSFQTIAWQDHLGGYLGGLLLAGPFDSLTGLKARLRRAS